MSTLSYLPFKNFAFLDILNTSPLGDLNLQISSLSRKVKTTNYKKKISFSLVTERLVLNAQLRIDLPGWNKREKLERRKQEFVKRIKDTFGKVEPNMNWNNYNFLKIFQVILDELDHFHDEWKKTRLPTRKWKKFPLITSSISLACLTLHWIRNVEPK